MAHEHDIPTVDRKERGGKIVHRLDFEITGDYVIGSVRVGSDDYSAGGTTFVSETTISRLGARHEKATAHGR